MTDKSFSKNRKQRSEFTSNENRKLPPLKSQDINKTFDYENGSLDKLICLEDMHEVQDEMSLNTPWHHPNKSIRTSKIVNMFEGSAMQTLANQTHHSGLVSSISKFNQVKEVGDYNHSARTKSVRRNDEGKDDIYIKRHLLKTRGLTALTRSINNDTKDAIQQIGRIERHRTSKLNKKLENVNLSKLIQDTNKEFKIALYDL